ncbi:hypothetical protein FOA52_006562 [Chlamydomonas sp. UWO 241]|nr:hypothetical protein FOA52_006562 [Chlamydomonas sp. UWO 241]
MDVELSPRAASVPAANKQPTTTASGYALPPGRRDMLDAKGRLMLKSLTRPELEAWAVSLGETANRALQLWRWMYADGCWVGDLQDTAGVQGGVSQKFIDQVSGQASADGGLQLLDVAKSKDGTRKLAFKLTQGAATGGTVETVLIPVVREAGQRNRITICVSSQVGCAMNCQFCYTGRMGLLGNLTAAQIVEQVVAARRYMALEGDDTPLTNLVFMGMGEPLHNADAVCAAIAIMTDHLGLHMSHNKITVSTVGLVPEIRAFAAAGTRAQLAVSLHATTDEALTELFPRGNEEGRSVLIEYLMLAGINDTEGDAVRLLALLEPIQCKVNLILFNPHAGTRFMPSKTEDYLAFRSTLIQGGRVCTIRDSRGDDEMAACGQLGDVTAAFRPSPLLPPPPSLAHLLQPAA